jgi:SAM-dependent methyltransferase
MAQPDLFPSTAMPDHDWWQALWPDPMAVVRAVGVSPGMTVVDVGCGDGHFTAPLAQLAGDEVYALDLDPAMLELARREVVRTRAPSPHWICGDAMELAALVPVQVDLALMANTFHGVPDKNRLAHAIARVVKPGGRWVIINWHRRPREETTVLGSPRGPRTELRMIPEAVRAAVEPAGFVQDKRVELPPYHYAVTFRRIGGASSQGGQE